MYEKIITQWNISSLYSNNLEMKIWISFIAVDLKKERERERRDIVNTSEMKNSLFFLKLILMSFYH